MSDERKEWYISSFHSLYHSLLSPLLRPSGVMRWNEEKGKGVRWKGLMPAPNITSTNQIGRYSEVRAG